jgi:hypothetical protein
MKKKAQTTKQIKRDRPLQTTIGKIYSKAEKRKKKNK